MVGTVLRSISRCTMCRSRHSLCCRQHALAPATPSTACRRASTDSIGAWDDERPSAVCRSGTCLSMHVRGTVRAHAHDCDRVESLVNFNTNWSAVFLKPIRIIAVCCTYHKSRVTWIKSCSGLSNIMVVQVLPECTTTTPPDTQVTHQNDPPV